MVCYSNGTDSVEHDNKQTKLNKLEKSLNCKKTRTLSFIGKTLIFNVLSASRFFYLAEVLSVPDWVLTHFRKIVFHFLWGFKIETVSCQTLSAPGTKCSLGVADLNAKCVALQLPLADRWKSVGNIGFENFKNDLACIITLQEVKVRDSLCSW